MSELEPCPFCGGKAICSNWGMWRAWCSECKSKGSDELTEKEAVAAWNRRAQPENEPLTLDQLRGMDGEPAYIVAHPDWGHWELSEDAEDYLTDRDPDFYGMKMRNDPEGRYGLHVLGWLAYRCKLETEGE